MPGDGNTSNKRTFYVLVVITVVMVLAALWSRWSSRETVPSYGLHVPDLGASVEAVRAVEIRTADSALHLERTDDGWLARNKDDFPAKAGRVRQLVLGISRLQRLDKKTSNPERFPRLELTDVDAPESKAVRVTLLDGAGDKLTDVLLGKTHEFQAAGRSRYFVRDAGETQSWLVEGALPPVPEDLPKWLEQTLLPGVERSALQSVEVVHDDGEVVRVHRDSAQDTDFQLAGLTGGEKIDNQYTVNAIADKFQSLSLKDVKKADGADSGDAVATVNALTFNGVRIVARLARANGDYGARLSASYEGTSGTGDGEAGGGRRLARDLNSLWRDRLFIVSPHSVDPLLVRHADLMKDKAPAGDG